MRCVVSGDPPFMWWTISSKLPPGKTLALSVPDELRINIRLLQIRADLKRHGIRVSRTLQETVIIQRKRSEKDRHLN